MVEDADMEFVDTFLYFAPSASKVVYVANAQLMLASIVRRGELSPPHRIAQIPDQNHYFILSSWSNDGRWILGGTNEGEIYVFNAESEEQEQILTEHFGDMIDLRWSSDGAYLASAAEDETVHIWDTSSWELVISLNVSEEIGSIAWSSDNCFIAIQTFDVEIWSLSELCN
jgi:WD40 repeat protein